MFKLRRLYVDTIGVPGNRFVDLCVDATDLAGEPCDTIVWLRNGAGKTTMLSLLLALVLPDRRDFLASRLRRRTLEDLVGGQDTAHVIAEWIDPRGQLLLTGAVYQWEGRTKPRDYNGEGKQRLRRYWWCLQPDDAVDGAVFDTLPTTSRTAGAVDLDRFMAHIGDLAARGVNATGSDNRVGEWHEALRQRHFDPDLFRYFAEVNASEGGIDALFAGIDSAGAFVRYLLRFVADERRVAPVRDLLGETAAEIAKRPVYAAELDFCGQAQPHVAALGDAHASVGSAAGARDLVRGEVAGFRKALLDAAESAQEESVHATGRRDDFETQRAEMRQRADTARRQRDEYKRLAAVFRLTAAQAAASAARDRADKARLDADAWAAVPDRAAVLEAQAALDAHRQVLRDAAADATPQLDACDRARAELAGSLEHHLAAATAQLRTLADAGEQAAGARTAAEARRRSAATEQARLRAEEGEHSRAIDRVEHRMRGLTAQLIVNPGERLAAAHDRLTVTAGRQQAGIDATAAAVEQARTQRAEVRAQLPAAQQDAQRAVRTYETLERQLAQLGDAAAALAGDSRLRQLAQADDIDPVGEADDLLSVLSAAIAAADAAAIDLRVEGTDDERAIAGLETDGVLPPRPAVERVVAALVGNGIGALPGWRYLKEHHTADAVEVIARRPDIADGVVVYSDPRTAAQSIADLPVADPVVIARASALAGAAASDGQGEERVVVGPSPARYDPAAADDELTRRRARTAIREQRLAAVLQRRRDDETLTGRLRELLRQVPGDGIAGLTTRTAAAHTAATAATEALDALTTRDNDLEQRLTDLGGELEKLRRALGQTARALTSVDAVLADERDIAAPARARLEAIPGLLLAAAETEQTAEQAIEDADAAIDTHRQAAVELGASHRTWTAERSTLGAATACTRPIEACRAVLSVAETALRENFPEAELRRNVQAAAETVQRLTKRYQGNKAAARARAERFLVEDPTAHDPDLRAAALSRAQDESAAARQDLGARNGEVDEATNDLDSNTPADRPRHTPDLPAEPVDRPDALRRAADAAEEAAARQADVGRLEKERDDEDTKAQRWAMRAGMLADQADKLSAVAPADLGSGDVSSDDHQVRHDVKALTGRLATVDGTFQAAMSLRSRCADTLRNWALQDRFARIADDEHGMAVRQMRDLLRAENLVERVAPRATDLAADLATREQAIAQQIAQVETHRRNVVARLGDLVTEALTDLSRASTLSELPEGIGPWAGQPFLSVGPRTRPTPEQVHVRIGGLVEQMVTAGKVDLDPVELLWRATEAAVIDGFRATILKPAPDQPSGRTRVEHMHKWSGGENLTASLVLFCVLAKLRTENRTGAKAGAAGGVVPLDNPLGKANYLPFLELQRRVAAANGVQLLFWTGIGDLAAVGAFPRITAMRKKPAAGRPGVAYVVADDTSTGATGVNLVERVSVVRVERPR